MNVDRQSRHRYAELLRHFAAGQLTNDQYEDATEHLMRSEDLALRELWWTMWSTYDDLREHRLTGEYKLPPEGRATVARMVLFLHSDLPYEWPVPWRFLGMLLNVCTLGLWGFLSRRQGNDDIVWSVWPFFRANDLAKAAARPRLLGGAR
jgi:hypothetical protein